MYIYISLGNINFGTHLAEGDEIIQLYRNIKQNKTFLTYSITAII
jgi:hypothetical protein